jgi:hypothetical protein
MAIMLIIFSTGAALFRDGLVRAVRRLLPHMHTITGALLTIAGLYLSYFWLRVKFGSAATLGDDPIVGFVSDFTSAIERIAAANGRPIIAVAAAVVIAIFAAALWRKPGDVEPGNASEEHEGEESVTQVR